MGSRTIGATVSYRAACLAVMLSAAAPAFSGDVLYEKGWTRIVTGDEAARLTRGMGDSVAATKVPPETIAAILVSLKQPRPGADELEAWREALAGHGWAQRETEPEYETYRAVQLAVVDRDGPRLLGRAYGLMGRTAEASCRLDGGDVQALEIALLQNLDRTVFKTVRSPASFVLNQEHFQKHFFEGMLNMDHPGLEAAKQAYAEKKILLAAHEVAEYYRRARHPVWESRPPEKGVDTGIDDAAERVLRHEFHYHGDTIRYAGRIDWYNNPTEDSEYLWWINRMPHWVTLLNGYLATGNEAYAREFNAEALDWVIRNPAPAFRLTRVPTWRNLEAGHRGAETWPHCFYGFLASPSFETHVVQLMLASLWSHAEHIVRFPSGMRFVNNWVITESSGLAGIGMSFPEFRRAPEWASIGLKRLEEQLGKQVYPDGTHHELASSYHISCINSFYKALRIALATGTKVPPSYRGKLEDMFQYLMYVCTPSRRTPPTNDGGRNDVTRLLNLGADLFDRQDMRWVATRGEDGSPPEETSHAFPFGGQFAMRSDWSEDAWHLYFDAGPHGVSHQHEDKLHFDVSALGRDFLTDGGKGLYVPDKWRDYFVSSAAHNTILVDGQGQSRMGKADRHRATSPLSGNWFSDDEVDFAAGRYDAAYGKDKISVTHQRQIIFKKREYWLVIDLLEGRGEHSFESLYHFTPGNLMLDPTTKSVRTMFAHGPNLLLSVQATLPLALRIAEGEEDPEQGWIDAAGSGRVPAPTLVATARGTLPVLLVTYVEPFRGSVQPPPQVEIAGHADDQVHITLKAGERTDRWVVNLANENQVDVDWVEKRARFFFRRIDGSAVVQEMERRF